MEDPLVNFETPSKGKPMVRDSNNYTYVANTSFTEVKYLKCGQLEFEKKYINVCLFKPNLILNMASLILAKCNYDKCNHCDKCNLCQV